MTRKAILALTLLGAALLPATSASAQTPPPLPGGGDLPPILSGPPSLTPFPRPPPAPTPSPGALGRTIRQFDCHTYWIRSSEPPYRYEQQTVCYGWAIT